MTHPIPAPAKIHLVPYGDSVLIVAGDPSNVGNEVLGSIHPGRGAIRIHFGTEEASADEESSFTVTSSGAPFTMWIQFGPE